MSEEACHSYEFGPFFVDADKRILWRDGHPLPLPPKVFETLLVLLDNRDHVLTKDELLTQVWGDTIVEEGGLARNVSLLRKALGEKPDDHQYIVTIPAAGTGSSRTCVRRRGVEPPRTAGATGRSGRAACGERASRS